MSTRWPVVLIVGLLLGCGGGKGGGDAKAGAGSGSAPAAKASADYATSTPDPNDPCTLVSQAEMEQLLGPLLEPPYRTSDRKADPRGPGCLYRAKDYRNVTLEVDRENGEMGFRMLAGMGGKVEEALAGADMSTDTLDANWDKVGRPFGQLIALKGTATVQVDPLGSRLELPAQVHILKLALARLSKPLGYDGGKAAQNHTDPGVKPRNPCSLVTRAEAEALMGTLRADPHPSEDGTECVFPMNAVFMGTPVDQTLSVQWSDGFYALGQERQAMGMAGKVMARSMGPDIPAVGENAAGEKEPWDERITLLGGVVTVIRRDVMLKTAATGVQGFDEAKALKLLRTAAQRI